MESVVDLLQFVYDVEGLIRWGGLLLIAVIVFTETGLLFGFFLPGDSLLVTAGLFARAGHLDLHLLLTVVTACAIGGDQLGYLIGRHAGRSLFRRPDSFFFRRSHLLRAQSFYERYGPKTIVLARFVPVVRTFAPVLAGIGHMEYRRFVTYNVLGGVLWVVGMVTTGYSLGLLIPGALDHLHIIIAVVIFVSLLPAAVEWRRALRTKADSPPPAAILDLYAAEGPTSPTEEAVP